MSFFNQEQTPHVVKKETKGGARFARAPPLLAFGVAKPIKKHQKTLRGRSLDCFLTFLESAGGIFEGFLAALGKLPKNNFLRVFG